MIRTMLAATSFAALMLAAPAMAQQIDFSKVEVKTTDLGNRTWDLEGQGGNVTVVVGDDGILVVDAQYPEMHDKLKAAIAAISKAPIRYIVNTHYHVDHSSGDALFAKEGAQIVAHDNVKKRLAEGVTNALTGAKTEPVKGDALPTKTYTSGKVDLPLKGRKYEIGHINTAHTDGDTYVYVQDANVLATGDIVSLGARYPNIDVAAAGNVKGMIQGLDTYLKLANDKTKIVPGHGPVIDKTRLAEYRAMIVDCRDRVQKLVKDGKSEDDAVAAKPLDDIGAKLGVNEQANANFVRLIYRSLKTA